MYDNENIRLKREGPSKKSNNNLRELDRVILFNSYIVFREVVSRGDSFHERAKEKC